MADPEEDFSSLPLTDRFTHKLWKVRKEAYEEVTQQFNSSASESASCFRPFRNDCGLWKSAVTDSNVAAQQEGITALCAFLKYGGRDGALKTRALTVTPMVEKCLSSTRAATKKNALEAILLYIELDVADPVVEDVLPGLSNKVPKNVAATLAALTAIFHNFGVNNVDPKPVLKALPKAFGAADKNIRAEATNLAVELYRWLREAIKPILWNALKPTQQAELEAKFEKIKAEPPPKQARLLRSQQLSGAENNGGGDIEEETGEEPPESSEMDAFSIADPVDISKKIPADFSEMLASSKWKDRKEAVDALGEVLNIPRIKDGDFSEVARGLAKCMKDANVAVVTQAARCLELLAKGLRQGFAKHRVVVMQPILDRLKEKKTTVTDALSAALDAVFAATNLSECMEDIIAYLSNKNPQVKEGTMRFLIRCIRTTREVPSKPEITAICEAAKKLVSESSPALRDGGAEILGTVMKITGERAVTQYIEGLDGIRKNKVKEFFETAEVKAKEKPKPKPKTKTAVNPPPSTAKNPLDPKKPSMKKPALSSTASASPRPAERSPLTPQPTSKSTLASNPRLGLPKASGLSGLKVPQRKPPGAPGTSSPRRALGGSPVMPAEEGSVTSSPQPRALPSRGLTGRSLAKPSTAPIILPRASPSPPSGLTAVERAELEELRTANERLTHQVEDLRHERSRFISEIQELKHQNAGLIEDHTRDVLSIKAKETQLVRARSDMEATEQINERLRRELERLKRALSRAEDLGAASGVTSPVRSPSYKDAGIYRDYSSSSANRNRTSFTNTVSEEKENGDMSYRKSKLAPELRQAGSSVSSGRGSPAKTFRNAPFHRDGGGDLDAGLIKDRPASTGPLPSAPGGGENWSRRTAEVTSLLKAKIEQMKAKQGVPRP